MEKRRRIVLIGCLGLTGLAMALAVACSGGVSQSDYDSVKKQLADEKAKTEALGKQAAPAPGGAGGVTTLLGAKQVPTPTPAPSPTPLPPGVTAAPRPTMPPSYGEPVAFSAYVEVLATTTPSKFGIASTIACTPSSVFKRGQKMVWRYEIFDMKTGKRITDKDEATVKVVLPNGDESAGRFSQRAGGSVPNAPWMWSSNWDIPTNYPLGAVDYKIVVQTKDGRSFEWKEPALVRQDSDSRPKVVE